MTKSFADNDSLKSWTHRLCPGRHCSFIQLFISGVLSAFNFVFSKLNAAQYWYWVIGNPVRVSFALCFVHLCCEAKFNQLCCIWLNLTVYPCTIHPPASSSCIFCHIINKYYWLSVIGSHAHQCQHTFSICFTDNVVWFGIWAIPSPFHVLFSFCHFVTVWSSFHLSHEYSSRNGLAFWDGAYRPSVFALINSSLYGRLK